MGSGPCEPFAAPVHIRDRASEVAKDSSPCQKAVHVSPGLKDHFGRAFLPCSDCGRHHPVGDHTHAWVLGMIYVDLSLRVGSKILRHGTLFMGCFHFLKTSLF